MRQFSQLPKIDEMKSEKDLFAISAETKTLPVSPAQTAPLRTSPLQTTPLTPPGTPRLASRLIVIPATHKRKKKAETADTPRRHLDPRLRRAILLVATVVFFAGTLLTLVPLSPGQNGFSIPTRLSNLIHFAQSGWQSLAQQDNSPPPSNANSGLPPMTIPHSQLVADAEQDATNAGISPTYFVRQINLESGFNPNAVSPSGAEGIAQFEPATAAGLGINPWDPVQALNAAAQMMARDYHQYGDYAKALAAYNAGPVTLQNAVNSCGANWLSCMPAQTQNYVAVIMG